MCGAHKLWIQFLFCSQKIKAPWFCQKNGRMSTKSDNFENRKNDLFIAKSSRMNPILIKEHNELKKYCGNTCPECPYLRLFKWCFAAPSFTLQSTLFSWNSRKVREERGKTNLYISSFVSHYLEEPKIQEAFFVQLQSEAILFYCKLLQIRNLGKQKHQKWQLRGIFHGLKLLILNVYAPSHEVQIALVAVL